MPVLRRLIVTTITQAAIDYAAEQIADAGERDKELLLAALYRAQGAIELVALVEDSERIYQEQQRIGLLIAQAQRGNSRDRAYPYDEFRGSWGDDDH
jgi:hypothetical protein